MTCAAYLDLIDWTGRCVREDKRGAIDPAALSILARLGLREEAWHHQVLGIEDRYWRVIGNAQAMIEKAAAIGQRWLKGIGNAPRGVASQAT